MPKYSYIAKSENKNVSGTMEASSMKDLAKLLRNENLFLIEAKEEGEKKKKKGEISLPFLGGVSLADKIFFTKNLHVMLSGGLSLSRTLRILSEQAKNRKLRIALADIREEIGKGNSFSQSLAKYPDIFSEMFQSMIQLSEETGTIEENLEILTSQLEKEYELKSKVKGALIYPAVIVSAMIGIGILMLTVVVPQLARTFEAMGAELPTITQIIIDVGIFLVNYWFLMIIFIFVFFYGVKRAYKTKKGKAAIDLLMLKTPLVSTITKQTNSAYTARTLSSLLSSGVPIVRGLEIISENLSNEYFKRAMTDSIGAMKEGGKLSQALGPHSEFYSPLMIQMIEVGEETGQTSRVLARTADFLEEEVFNLTKNLTSIIEPILMVVIGGAVGFFAISMLQPIYSMLGNL